MYDEATNSEEVLLEQIKQFLENHSNIPVFEGKMLKHGDLQLYADNISPVCQGLLDPKVTNVQVRLFYEL